MKKLLTLILTFALLFTPTVCLAYTPEEEYLLDVSDVSEAVFAEGEIVNSLDVASQSAILVEKTTGKVLFEKSADEPMPPASVTKVMTMLLVCEAVESGKISLDDTVTASAHAASMGGSQIFLAEGESMSARDMLKSVAVASANDAAVALGEHICGTEEAFADKMNARAAELGMKNTHFVNCTGLTDSGEHCMSARDIALVSRELLSHDWIKEFTTVWTDTVRGGEFGLANTNKLIRFFPGATGLKTGFTSNAMYCLSASAERDGAEYIAVTLHAPTSAERFEDAKKMLLYAFANFTLINAVPDGVLPPVEVSLGTRRFIQPELDGSCRVVVRREDEPNIVKEVILPEKLVSPVAEGEKIGTYTVRCGDEVLLSADITASECAERLTLGEIFARLLKSSFCCVKPAA